MLNIYDFFNSVFEGIKRRAQILILGAYGQNLARLKKLRNCLHRKGFLSASLAADFKDDKKFDEDENVHNLLKSQFLIRFWADVIIFVFFNTDNVGVSTELKYFTERVLEKQHLAVVLIEEGYEPSSLAKAQITKYNLKSNKFSDDSDMCEQAHGYCTNILTRYHST